MSYSPIQSLIDNCVRDIKTDINTNNRAHLLNEDQIYTRVELRIEMLLLREINAIVKAKIPTFDDREFEREMPNQYRRYFCACTIKSRKIKQISYYITKQLKSEFENRQIPVIARIEAGGRLFNEDRDLLRVQDAYYGIPTRVATAPLTFDCQVVIARVIEIPVGILVEDESSSDEE